MPMTIKKIESEALNLDIHSRGSLVGKLLLSLDEPTVSEVEQLWLDKGDLMIIVQGRFTVFLVTKYSKER